MSTKKQTDKTKTEYSWSDISWLSRRKATLSDNADISLPINIYELNLRNFLSKDSNARQTYAEISKALIPYLKYMSYTHVEVFFEYGGSAGGGYIRPGLDTELGTSDDFKHFIDELHTSNLGIILDLGAIIEVNARTQQLYINDILALIKEYHIDGLKFSLCQSTAFKSHGFNSEFIGTLNASIHSEFPDVITIAFSDEPIKDITMSVNEGGLGFTCAWNTALMRGIYEYLSAEQVNRKYLHKSVAASRKLFLNERYIIPLHHGDLAAPNRSFINKINGNYEDKFRQMRTALLLLMTLPGKKQLFMGSEFAQFKELDKDGSLEWFMLDFPAHRNMRDYVAELNRLYLESPPLWTYDFTSAGFEWISKDKSTDSVFSFKRKSKNEEIYVVFNFSPEKITTGIPLTSKGEPKCIFSSNPDGTDNLINVYNNAIEHYMDIQLSPYTAKIFKQSSISKNLII